MTASLYFKINIKKYRQLCDFYATVKVKKVKVTRYVPILAHWGRGGIATTLS
jgi:hypothetical protein